MYQKIWPKIIGLAVFVLIVTYVGVRMFAPQSVVNPSAASSDLAKKVLAAKEIRVGYVVYPPSLIKDESTGKLSGIFYDALNEAGRKLGLKVDWAVESSWATMLEDMNSGKFDMIGSPVWPSSPRSTQAAFSVPLMYSVIGAYVRPNDHRFDQRFDGINSPDVKIAVIDGELSQTIVKEQFTNAKIDSLPQTAAVSQDLLDVQSGKADVAFVELPIANDYLKNNPGAIRNAQPANPIRYNGNVMVMPQNQTAFKEMIDTALGEELNSGYIDALLKKYDTSGGSFYPIAKPYALPK